MLSKPLGVRALAAALAPVFLAASPAAAGACPDAGLRPTDAADAPAYERAVRCLIDAERTERSRPALDPDPRLAEAAHRYAEQLVARKTFSHRGADGSDAGDRAKRAGYGGSGRLLFGEILAWGSGTGRTPAAIVRAWMNSSGHRRVLLEERFRDVGVGLSQGAPNGRRGGVTVAVTFGRIG